MNAASRQDELFTAPERSDRAADPDNRLVVRTLERRWEEALRREQEVREGYDRFRRESPRKLGAEELGRIRALAADIPALWNAADTPAADRKEIVRALVERVTVTIPGDAEQAVVRIEWIGGAATEHVLRRPISCYRRLADFARMRRLVESAVAAGRRRRSPRSSIGRASARPAAMRTASRRSGPGAWCTGWASARGGSPPRAWRPTNRGSATWRTNSPSPTTV
jgi:hypothetical protein